MQPRVFDPAVCRHIARALRIQTGPVVWTKGRAPVSPLFYELATAPAIVATLKELLGDDVMLWGASIVSRRPGQVHPWHTDIETYASDGQAVSVWIGVRNTNERSSLQVISGSHRLGMTIQEVASRAGQIRGEADREDVVRWAAEADRQCTYTVVPVTDGDAVFFDGRLWHGSDNTNTRGTRTALLLQYATPDCAISIPDASVLEFPFRFHSVPKPPCIMVAGSSRGSNNEFVPPPQYNHSVGTLITKWISSLDPPPSSNDEPWVPHPIFRGRTRSINHMACHMSLLKPGHTPHPPHHHEEEEILVMLSGEAKLVTVDGASQVRRERHVGRGDFAYYPAGSVHTITSAGEEPARYVMFKWRGRAASRSREEALAFLEGSVFEESAVAETNGASFHTALVFEGATSYLRKLHCHKTSLASGAGYPPHTDAYDVAIVLLEGKVETMGATVSNDAVIFCSAGEPHGMKNVGTDTARYLVFEFHGGRFSLQVGWPLLRRRALKLARRIAREARVDELVRRVRRLGGG